MSFEESRLLSLWERGASRSNPERALLLMEACRPGAQDAELLNASIGARDACLLELRERLFGPRVRCLARCETCNEPLELEFDIADVRAPHAGSGDIHELVADEHRVRFRIPCNEDLIALSGTIAGDSSGAGAGAGAGAPEATERLLFLRCVDQAFWRDAPLAPESIPAHVLEAVASRMADIDAQADVVLSVACPACGRPGGQVFDIASFLWTELDAWSRDRLQQVHELALAYGWSEAEILAMSPARRRAYLELVERLQ